MVPIVINDEHGVLPAAQFWADFSRMPPVGTFPMLSSLSYRNLV